MKRKRLYPGKKNVKNEITEKRKHREIQI